MCHSPLNERIPYLTKKCCLFDLHNATVRMGFNFTHTASKCAQSREQFFDEYFGGTLSLLFFFEPQITT